MVHIPACRSANSAEVEFARASGTTQALVQLTRADIRLVADSDVPVVRDTSSHGGAA